MGENLAQRILEQPGRVAAMPVPIMTGVTVEFSEDDRVLTMKSSKGQLNARIHKSVLVKVENDQLLFLPLREYADSKAQAGTARANAANMMTGLVAGFEKKLVLIGVGYKAKLEGKTLVVAVGYSNDKKYAIPEGIQITVPTQTEIVIQGVDVQKVGQVAAEIRRFRPPSPYKGKGIRYHGEEVKLKDVNK